MSFPTQESLEQRVIDLRESAADSNEFVDAVWELSSTLWFEPKRLEPLVDEALKVADKNEYRLGIARCKLVMAEAKFIQVQYDKVMPYLEEGLPVIVELGLRREYAWCMLILGALNQMAGAYDQALEHCFKGRQAATESDSEEAGAWLHYRTADVYRELGDTERMLQHAKSCFEKFESLYPRSLRRQHRIGTGRARTLLGAAHLARGDFDEAYRLNTEALDIYREVEDQLGETRALSDLGQIHLRKGDLDDAERYLRESMEIREKLGHRASLASNLFTLGEIYLARSDTDQALTTFHDMLEIAREGGVKMRAYQAHEALARVFQASGYSDQALIHYKKYHAIKEEVAGEAMNLRVHNMKILSDIAAAEREAELERERNQELQSKNEELAALLAKLKATQDRLIQSEKMASLGQLTAGIAHEIRNPLNFVNNFADLTAQIVSETEQFVGERKVGLPDDVVEEFEDLLETLKFNATKIRQHGKRADRIVQSMLEHSRGGEGRRVSTDVNKLLDECLNLAYHGMRARESDFNVTVQRNLDETLPEIELVSQDVGRVFLNILSNAFDALHSDGPQSSPMISVSTTRKDDGIEIRIGDNGPGIPPEHRDKIFEPFFTTKPSGSGTGLGLSLAYDIITKGCGGSLELTSGPVGGAEFVIWLPESSPLAADVE
jgi:signal transduction histidine kinase